MYPIGPQPAEDNGKCEHHQPDAVSGQADPVRRTVLFQKAENSFFNEVVTGFSHDRDRYNRKHLRNADGQRPGDDGFPLIFLDSFLPYKHHIGIQWLEIGNADLTDLCRPDYGQ